MRSAILSRNASNVAPRAGAGIEIITIASSDCSHFVAPRAGAGIEIRNLVENEQQSEVAPRAGAGIEIDLDRGISRVRAGRPSRRGGN